MSSAGHEADASSPDEDDWQADALDHVYTYEDEWGNLKDADGFIVREAPDYRDRAF